MSSALFRQPKLPLVDFSSRCVPHSHVKRFHFHRRSSGLAPFNKISRRSFQSSLVLPDYPPLHSQRQRPTWRPSPGDQSPSSASPFVPLLDAVLSFLQHLATVDFPISSLVQSRGSRPKHFMLVSLSPVASSCHSPCLLTFHCLLSMLTAL